MATLNRFRVTWSGLSGLPGVSTFYGVPSGPTPDMTPALRTFFEAIKVYIPAPGTISYPTVADQIEDTTGDLVGAASMAGGAVTTGTGSTTYAAPTGLAVRWTTAGIVRSHRVGGRTFLVPLSVGSPTAGAPGASQITAVNAAATALVTALASTMTIWARPLIQRNDDGTTTVLQLGSHHNVLSGAAIPKFVVLRSRRD
jgi:hypothetical protein